MKLPLFIFVLFMRVLAFGQETLDVQFLTTQRSSGNPFALPVLVTTDGEVSLVGGNGDDNIIFRPTLQVGLSRAVINYAQPVILNRFNFYPQNQDLGWVEVKRLRVEGGIGLASIIRSSMMVGFIPYKGAMHTIIRYKKSKSEKSLPFSMPEKLSDLEQWNVNDMGTFQTYGGITFYGGVSVGIVDVATGSIGVQNQFVIEMKKISPQTVKLLISEEDLKRRQIVFGPVGVKGTLAQFKGKRLLTEFTFYLDNPEHHDLFQEALKGNIHLLQEKLDSKLVRLSWKGKDRQWYFGIPAIIGKVFDSGHYDLDEDNKDTMLSFTGSRTKGILTPMRNFQDFVYQSGENMVLVWSSEMNKTDKWAFDRRFLAIGRTIGVKGFNREVPDGTLFGSVVSQIGIHLSQKEIEALRDIDWNDFMFFLKQKCETEKLSCRRDSRANWIMERMSELMAKPWKEMRGELGLFLIKEPAIIHAVARSLKVKKEVYFKFLSEKYQSLEGSAPIEL